MWEGRGFLGGASGKELACQCRRHKRHRFDPWVGTIPWRRYGNSLQHSCLGNSMDRGASRAILHRVTKNQIWVKRLSMHPCSGGVEIWTKDLHPSGESQEKIGGACRWTWYLPDQTDNSFLDAEHRHMLYESLTALVHVSDHSGKDYIFHYSGACQALLPDWLPPCPFPPSHTIQINWFPQILDLKFLSLYQS